MQGRVCSITEIGEIEAAYRQGVPALGHAAAELLRRWRFPLRDHETFLRLAFLAWYREHEPEWLTGLEADLPGVEDLITERGGESSLTPEELFTLAVLWDLFPSAGMSDESARVKAHSFAKRAAESEPTSPLFRDWRFFLGEAEDTTGPRIYIEPEVHARFHRRGAMGEYLEHTLVSQLRRDRRPATSV